MARLNFSFKLGADVIAVTSDGAVNFHNGEANSTNDFVLTHLQQQWLSCNKITPSYKLIFPQQVHGDVVWKVSDVDVIKRWHVEADAVMTDVVGLPIAVRTADCLPLLLYAPQHRVIAAVHAGWRSTRLEIVRKSVEAMMDSYGVKAEEIRAVIGPCIRRESYRVGSEFEEYFPQDVLTVQGQLCFDIASANTRQLCSAGVPPENIWDCDLDTFTDTSLHSFRRDGEKAGRMLNVIMMR